MFLTIEKFEIINIRTTELTFQKCTIFNLSVYWITIVDHFLNPLPYW